MSYYAPGKYRARIASAGLGESESKRTPQVEIVLDVLWMYDESGRVKMDGQAVVYMALTEGTLGTTAEPGWVMQTLTAFGFRGPSFADLDALVGRECDARCEEDTYDGKAQTRWSIFRPFNGPKNPASRQTVSSLDAKFAALLNAAKKLPAAAPASAGKTDDPGPAQAQPAAARSHARPAGGSNSSRRRDDEEDEIPF